MSNQGKTIAVLVSLTAVILASSAPADAARCIPQPQFVSPEDIAGGNVTPGDEPGFPLTISVPGLRTMLGLVPLDGPALGLVAGSLLVTVIGAEIWSRRAVQRGDDF